MGWAMAAHTVILGRLTEANLGYRLKGFILRPNPNKRMMEIMTNGMEKKRSGRG